MRGGDGGRTLGADPAVIMPEAEVVELLPNATYRLKLENEQEVTAHAAGAAQTNFVRLRPGDRVEVELSPHDRGRGRITKLLRKS